MNTLHRHKAAAVLFLLFSGLLWSCYPRPIGPADPQGKRLTWSEMNPAQRKALMRSEILPLAGQVFGAWRPEKYATVNCALCHGPGAKINSFEMPTAYLPRLSGKLLLGPEFANHPDTTRLKLKRLVPAMADALGKKPFSVVTRRGFGCYSCHLGPDGPLFGN